MKKTTLMIARKYVHFLSSLVLFQNQINRNGKKNGLNGYFRTLQGIFFLKVFQAFSKDFSHQYYVVGFLLKNILLFKEPYNLNLFPMHMVLSKSQSKHRKRPVSP